MSDLAGESLSLYKILEKIGQGGMGIVFKAHDTSLNRKDVLKFLPEPLIQDAETNIFACDVETFSISLGKERRHLSQKPNGWNLKSTMG